MNLIKRGNFFNKINSTEVVRPGLNPYCFGEIIFLFVK